MRALILALLLVGCAHLPSSPGDDFNRLCSGYCVAHYPGIQQVVTRHSEGEVPPLRAHGAICICVDSVGTLTPSGE